MGPGPAPVTKTATTPCNFFSPLSSDLGGLRWDLWGRASTHGGGRAAAEGSPHISPHLFFNRASVSLSSSCCRGLVPPRCRRPTERPPPHGGETHRETPRLRPAPHGASTPGRPPGTPTPPHTEPPPKLQPHIELGGLPLAPQPPRGGARGLCSRRRFSSSSPGSLRCSNPPFFGSYLIYFHPSTPPRIPSPPPTSLCR